MEYRKNQPSIIYVEMENVVARFIHSYNSNALHDIGTQLFVNDDSTSLVIEDEGINCTGYPTILMKLQDIEELKNSREEKYISILASPSYKADFSTMTGNMIGDIYTYRIYRDSVESKMKCELIISKLEITFQYQEKELKINSLVWNNIQSMVPWNYDDSYKLALTNAYKVINLPKKKIPLPEDIIQIRNLQNYFFERRMIKTEQLFSNEVQTSFYIEPLCKKKVIGKDKILNQINDWLTSESENNGYYILLGITSAPIIEINREERTAQGLFLVETFQLGEKSNNQAGIQEYPLKRNFCIMESSYTLEEGIWKIQSISMKTLAELPVVPYTAGRRYDLMSGYPAKWNFDQQSRKGKFVEDVYQIESLLHRWVYYCRCGELTSFYEKYMKNEFVNCRMLIRSQGEKSAQLSTEDDIRKRLSGMDQQFHKLMYSYHTTTTPIIEIDEDGLFAKGTWFDHSATNLLGTSKSRDSIPYMVFVAKYVHEFHKLEGKWYLTNFYWEPLISLPDWEFNLSRSKGFVTKKNAEQLINPFDIDKK